MSFEVKEAQKIGALFRLGCQLQDVNKETEGQICRQCGYDNGALSNPKTVE